MNLFLKRTAPYFASVAAVWLILVIFSLNIGSELRLFYNVIYFVGDAVLLMLPMWFLGKWSKLYAGIVVWLICAYLTASAMYFRFWGDLLPLQSIFLAQNYNGFVFESAASMVGWLDWLMLIPPVCLTVFLWKYKPPTATVKFNLSCCAASVCVFLLANLVSFIHRENYVKHDATRLTRGFCEWYKVKFPTNHSHSATIYEEGFVSLMSYQIHSLIQNGSKTTLTKEETVLISETLSNMSGELASEYIDIFSANRDKNLIFIIVESLNADAIGRKICEKSVTPVLDSLLLTEGTIAALNMTSQVAAGGSSDGQMILNTGLLPLINGVVAQSYSRNRYISLAEQLNKSTALEFMVGSSAVWNHKQINGAYGYDGILDQADIAAAGIDAKEVGGDAALFDLVMQKLPQMSTPFFVTIGTLSMHFPFADPGIPQNDWIAQGEGLSDLEVGYLQALHYFDRELGRFIDNLKCAGLFDNSVIVLASDHEQPYKGKLTDKLPIAFIALNTGVTKTITDRQQWQIDVYPTVLDIMGIDSTGYSGLGQSLLIDLESDRTDEELQHLKQISDLIIRSDYFSITN